MLGKTEPWQFAPVIILAFPLSDLKKKKLSKAIESINAHSFHWLVNIFHLYLMLSSGVIIVLKFQIRFPSCISHRAGGSGSSKSCCSVTKLLGLTPAPLRITASKIQLMFRLFCWLRQLDYHWELTVPSPTWSHNMVLVFTSCSMDHFFKVDIFLDFLRIFTASNNRDVSLR